MSCTEELIALLRPLGVYSFREGSFSLGELQALGKTLDELETWAQTAQRESIVLTAQAEGLERMEELFRHGAVEQDTEARRKAIAVFLQIGGDSFTAAALNRCLRACGVPCTVEETGEVNRVKVWFPGVMGVPEGFSWMRAVIEVILPCQLGIFYWFRYCTWQETEQYRLTWGALNAMSWTAWMLYHEGPVEP